MYGIQVDMFLIALIVAVGGILFFGSVAFVLIEAGSQAIARGVKKYARAAAKVRLQELQPPQLQPERTVSRAHSRA